MRLLPLPFLLVATSGCGFVDAPGEPLYEAHRGAAAHWAQNSRTAMIESMRADYDALEFDVVLTADGVPIIAHDPWFHDPLCTNSNGSDLVEDVRIDTLTYEEATAQIRCGGKPDPAFPDAAFFSEPVMSVQELFDVMQAEMSPDMLVHIDIKYEPGLTPPADDFAQAVMPLWVQADLPNDFYVSANTAEAIIAFEQWGDDNGVDVPTSIAWPTFPPGSSSTAIGLGNEFGAAAGTVDLVQVIRAAQADGVAATHRIIDRRQVQEVVDHGYFVSLWTINDADLLKTYSKFPVRSLITDDPELRP